MFYLLIYALLARGADGPAVAQHRVDRLIRRCSAGKVVKLLARGGNEVSIHMLIATRAPTTAENRKFECVLRGMKKMPKLHFGFIGNEAMLDGS